MGGDDTSYVTKGLLNDHEKGAKRCPDGGPRSLYYLRRDLAIEGFVCMSRLF